MKTRVEVRESPIHGIGVFAIEDILEGDMVGIMSGVVSAEADPHSDYVCEFVDVYTENVYYIEPFTPFKYINHSVEANVDWDTPVLVALRDIKAGEELTIDYGEEFQAELERDEDEEARCDRDTLGDRRDDSESERGRPVSGEEDRQADGGDLQEEGREGSPGPNLGDLAPPLGHSRHDRVSDASSREGTKAQPSDEGTGNYHESQADGFSN